MVTCDKHCFNYLAVFLPSTNSIHLTLYVHNGENLLLNIAFVDCENTFFYGVLYARGVNAFEEKKRDWVGQTRQKGRRMDERWICYPLESIC